MVYTIKRAFRSYNGRHFLSRWARNTFERSSIHKHIGYTLASGLLIVSLIDPAVSNVSAHQQVEQVEQIVVLEAVPQVKTETTLSWPVYNPLITQGFRFGHTGIDVQDTESTDIYPIDEGWVSGVYYWNYGYGYHVIIQHPNGRSSMYAHFEDIYVEQGQVVTRETVLGKMGQTGWASGIHLHLEIYQDGLAYDPIAILPDNENLIWRPYTSDHDVFSTTDESVVVTAESSE